MKKISTFENTLTVRITAIAAQLTLAFSILTASTVHAAKVVAINPVSNVAGTTSTHNGSTFTFDDLISDKYESTTTVGADTTVTLKSPTYNNDTYIQKASSISLDTRTYRYAQVFYTLSDDFSGTTHQLRLDTTGAGEVQAFVTFSSAASIPSTAGSHSFVIDLFDGTDLDTTTSGRQYSGNLTFFRWDFWNNTGNAGKSFTLHKVVFGTVQSGDTVLPSEYGFETPVITIAGYSASNPSPSAWSFGATAGICGNTGARMLQCGDADDGKAAEGIQSAFLLGNGAYIRTTVTGHQPRATYTLSFDAAGRRNAATYESMKFEVLLNGSALTFSGTNSITPVQGYWNAYTSAPFTAPNGAFTLNFNGLYNVAFDNEQSSYIDFVRFNYVDAGPPAGTILIIR